MASTLVSHFTHLFSSNSTIGRMSIEKWENFTGYFENMTFSDVAMDTLETLNETVQEGMENLG